MRAWTGLGFFAIFGFLSCAADDGTTTSSSPSEVPPSGDTGNNDDSTSSDPHSPDSRGAGDDDPGAPEAPPGPIAQGIAITDVAVLQAVKVSVVRGGTSVPPAARKAPVVAKRPGLLRVYVKPEPGWSPRAVTAELRLAGESQRFPVLRETKTVSAASTDEDLASTFDFELPADSLPPGVTFQVSLSTEDGVSADSEDRLDGRYPRDGGYEELGAELAGKVRVVIVPVRYDADGSGRTPELGPEQLERYRSTMMRLYPTSEVVVTAREPFPWNSQISSGGGGFSQVLRAMMQLRENDKVEKDVYYYGVFMPKDSMNAYCAGGCVTGLSTVVDDAGAAAMRASVGVGFAGQLAANTMAHEIGHAHGRRHAPCGGTQGADPGFPYTGGKIGEWGYDIFAKKLIAPAKGTDIMGYCANQWVSDYTYNALYDRIAAISVERHRTPETRETRPTTSEKLARYRVATALESGDLTWDGELDLDEELAGGVLRKANFLADSGKTIITRTARFFPFDHLPGGFVFVPADNGIEATKWKAVTVEGFTQTLAR